jgi:hypothetical protein
MVTRKLIRKMEDGSMAEYESISDMLRDTGNDELTAEYESLSQSRRLIRHLMVRRATLGMTQHDIAILAGFPLESIRSIEESTDDDLYIYALRKYANAVGCSLTISISSREAAQVELSQNSARMRAFAFLNSQFGEKSVQYLGDDGFAVRDPECVSRSFVDGMIDAITKADVRRVAHQVPDYDLHKFFAYNESDELILIISVCFLSGETGEL